MSDRTTIEWTDSTWNPIRGTLGRWFCTKVSAGCKNCYAERINVRFGGPRYVVGEDTPRLDTAALERPRRWRRPRRIFVCDMSDLFFEEVGADMIQSVFDAIAAAPQHTYQILTKRVARAAQLLPHIRFPGGMKWMDAPSKNVWIGVSAEDQKTADERVPLLLRTPAAVRFVSAEPLLGEVNLRGHLMGMTRLDWVIVGGESGPNARPMNLEWARDAIRQCQEARVPVFYKQGGALNRCEHNSKGGHFECFPEDLKVREFPVWAKKR